MTNIGKTLIKFVFCLIIGLIVSGCQAPLLQDGAGTSKTTINFALPTGNQTGSRSLTGSFNLLTNIVLIATNKDSGSVKTYQGTPTINGAQCSLSIANIEISANMDLSLTAYWNTTAIYQGSVQNCHIKSGQNSITLKLIPLYPSTTWSLAAKEDYFLLLDNSGVISNSGSPKYSSAFDLSWITKPVKQVVAGRVNAAALYTDGTVGMYSNTGYTGLSAAAAGSDDGEISGTTALNSSTFLAGRTITRLEAAPHHFLALLSDGSLWGWGINLTGQLGTANSGASTAVPQQIAVSNIVDFGGGGTGSTGAASNANGYTAVLRSDGTVWVMGSATLLGGTIPTQVPGLTDVIKIACGYDYILALKKDGSVWGWGSNNVYGTYATIDWTQPSTLAYSSPHQVPLAKAALSIAAGWSTSASLLADGTLQSWGGIIMNDAQFSATILDLAVTNFKVIAYLSDGKVHCYDGSAWTLFN